MKTARPSRFSPDPADESQLPTAETAMRARFLVLRTRGRTSARTAEEFYGFRPEDVAELHFRKRGQGRGCWYRLHDGRVFDAAGRPSEPERHWYKYT